MAEYVKQVWKDAFVDDTGNVIEAGTLITKERMEHIEDGVSEVNNSLSEVTDRGYLQSKVITSGSVNSITQSGKYAVDGTKVSDCPTNNQWFDIDVTTANGDYAVQIATSWSEIKTYKRQKMVSVWTPWQEIATMDKVSNRNLLDNWDFRNPVNQRGEKSYKAIFMRYTIDRWVSNYSTDSGFKIELTNNGLKLSCENNGTIFSYAAIGQSIEQPELYAGKTITLSAKVTSGGGYIVCGIGITSGATNAELHRINCNGAGIYKTTFICPSITTKYPHLNICIHINDAGTPIVCEAVKLELGTVSTLANDPPQNYGTELAKCQRYYQRLAIPTSNDNFAWIDNAGNAGFILPMPNMRLASPTCKLIGAAEAQLRFSDGTAVSNVPLRDMGYRVGLVFYSFKKDNTTLPIGACAYIITGGFAEIELSAEL